MKQIRLNAFVMNSVTHSYQGLWCHPRDHSLDYKDLRYWMEFAKLLEKGKFDGIFLADSLGVHDVYGGSAEAALRGAVMIPKNDPSLLVPAMATVTTHLGFGITFSVLDEPPYAFARKISTLDHLTSGRVGWNIVTGYLESGAKARGDVQLTSHDERYVIAEEYMDVVYRLWESSWEDSAVRRDRENCIYTDPSKVHRIRHDGQYFKVDAVHMCEPSPQRTPVLYQAGASAKGMEFGAKHAECVFVSGPQPSNVGRRVKKIREEAMKHGRDPYDIQALLSLTVITAPTDAEAQRKHQEYSRYIDRTGSLVRLSGFIGTDLSTLRLDDPIKGLPDNGGIQSILENLTAARPDKAWTVSDVANSLNPDGVHPLLIGSPQTVVDGLQRWVEEADVDGFNLGVTVKPESMSDFVELVVPELQRRGLYKTEYGQGTLREKLFSKSAKTAATHPSAQYRRP
ncbi:MAG TPA: LLM class flavin-dependent oxidoreductase [Candidatus Saccharimonadales bacterium]|nr:LLM class flavin-dependent oxidoreductase [Candidatus Saccharimonadales bacterium]